MYKFFARMLFTIHVLWALLLIVIVPLLWFSLISKTWAIAILGITIASETVLKGNCFLTVWEKKLTEKAGTKTYTGTFLGYYLRKVSRITLSDGQIQLGVIVWFFVIAISIWY